MACVGIGGGAAGGASPYFTAVPNLIMGVYNFVSMQQMQIDIAEINAGMREARNAVIKLSTTMDKYVNTLAQWDDGPSGKI